MGLRETFETLGDLLTLAPESAPEAMALLNAVQTELAAPELRADAHTAVQLTAVARDAAMKQLAHVIVGALAGAPPDPVRAKIRAAVAEFRERAELKAAEDARREREAADLAIRLEAGKLSPGEIIRRAETDGVQLQAGADGQIIAHPPHRLRRPTVLLIDAKRAEIHVALRERSVGQVI